MTQLTRGQPVPGLRGSNRGDVTFQGFTLLMASIILLLVAGIALFLLVDAWPALQRYRLQFFLSSEWNPVTEQFGVWPYAYGTLVASLLGLLFATPISVGAALYVTEYAPRWLQAPVSFLVEMLAAIPSVIYGVWGFFVLAPLMQAVIEPALQNTLGLLPVIGRLFSGPILGKDILTAGIILAIMITPTIMSVSREVIAAVPDTQREGMLALGATKWEMIRYAVVPYARAGLVGAAMLGLGRALGETMAVALVIGNSSRAITGSLFEAGYTMASAIALQFRESDKPIYTSAIVGVAVTLLLVTAVVNLLARFLVYRFARGPIGVRI
ncbi:MAG: phosphate ABC transporter permease subunit PstC [Chloroflexi bacterium]|nr:phosphate ABC transporter permease subunit PstC [Chloroflexota bacterium]